MADLIFQESNTVQEGPVGRPAYPWCPGMELQGHLIVMATPLSICVGLLPIKKTMVLMFPRYQGRGVCVKCCCIWFCQQPRKRTQM